MSERPPQVERTPKNFYDTIGMSRDASLEALRERCLALIRAAHPDSQGDVSDDAKREAHRVTAYLNEIYDTFKSPEKRKRYDASLPQDPLRDERAVFDHVKRREGAGQQRGVRQPSLTVEHDGNQYFIRDRSGRVCSVFDEIEYFSTLLVGVTYVGTDSDHMRREKRIIKKETGKPSLAAYEELRMIDTPTGFQQLVGVVTVGTEQFEALVDPEVGEPFSRVFHHIWFDPQAGDGMLRAGMGGNKRRDPRRWLVEYRLDPRTGHDHLSKSVAA